MNHRGWMGEVGNEAFLENKNYKMPKESKSQETQQKDSEPLNNLQ